MTARRINVDFTSLSGGRVRARIADADGPIFSGDPVLAVDPDDELCADAVVTDMKDSFAYLDVDWSSQRDLDSADAVPQCVATVFTWRDGYGFVAAGPENTGAKIVVSESEPRGIWAWPLVRSVDPEQSRVLSSL